ncbi:hypothetical protein DSM112329_00857 [Paraconexibacter sp. AEG42_29]|uniref:FAS1-like dehydratase domain-containing protein n=1 Tax=Paraconexibacter sp. AEG42_29 TaxID=2997339 RepID=A0AAU7ARB1_9ACTN
MSAPSDIATPDVGFVVDSVSFPIEEGKLREFAIASGGDPDAVLAAGVLPPTFAAVAAHWRDQAAMVRVLQLDIRRVVVGGSEWEYGAPAWIGDRLTGDRVVTDVAVKSSGMLILTLTTTLRREDGEVAVTQRDTVIQVPPKGSPGGLALRSGDLAQGARSPRSVGS